VFLCQQKVVPRACRHKCCHEAGQGGGSATFLTLERPREACLAEGTSTLLCRTEPPAPIHAQSMRLCQASLGFGHLLLLGCASPNLHRADCSPPLLLDLPSRALPASMKPMSTILTAAPRAVHVVSLVHDK
jgi:hypothetical protein